MNDSQSTKSKILTISFDLQAESCTLDPECAPTSEQRKLMNNSTIAIL